MFSRSKNKTLKSPFQFGDRPQIFFIITTIPFAKLC